MKISQAKIEGLTHTFQCTIAAQEFQERLEKFLLGKGADLRIQGFRPGKVPLPILKQRYGDSARRELLDALLDEGVSTILKDKAINYIGRPHIHVDAFNESGELAFTVAIEQYPEFDSVNLSSLKVERLKPVLDEQEVNQVLERLAREHNHPHPVKEERPAKSGDTLRIDYQVFSQGKLIKDGEIKDFIIDLGSGQMLPGFEDQLIGTKVGMNCDFTLSVPKDFHEEEYAGKELTFKVHIHQLLQRGAAEINDHLAEHIGFSTLNDLKDAVKQRLEEEYGDMAFTLAKRSVLDQLADKVAFPLPEKIVEQEYEALVKELSHAEEASKSAKKTKTADAPNKEWRSLAERRVRLAILLADIGKKDNIELSQSELQAVLFKELQKYAGQEKKVLAYYQKNPSALEHLKAPAYENKVIQAILAKAKVTERTVSLEDLRKTFSAMEQENLWP